MSVWIWSGRTALVVGSLLFAGILIPLLAWQSRRYGRLDARRMAGSAAVSLYLTALVTYTWLPLPERSAAYCAAHAVRGVRLDPLHSVGDIQRAVGGLPFAQAATSETLLQVVFNVLLFVPWGVIAVGFLHRGILAATLSGLAASLFIEVTQATGLWFVYPCAYRLGDVDDVLTNTLGALLGALVAPALLWWMPKARTLAASRLTPRPVTTARRWAGMAVDAFCVVAIDTALTITYRIARIALGYPALGPDDDRFLTPLLVVPWLVVFCWPAWNGGRAGSGSAGQNALWLTPVWYADEPGGGGGPGGRGGTMQTDGTRLRRLVRASVIAGPWTLLWMLAVSPVPWAGRFGFVLVLAAVLAVPFTRTHRGISGVLTGAEMADIRALTLRDAGDQGDQGDRRDGPARDRLSGGTGGADPGAGRTTGS